VKTFEAVEELKTKYGDAIIRESDCCGQITLEMHKEHLIEVLAFLKEMLGYEVLMDLTGVDYLEPIIGTQIVYWLHNPTDYQRVRICLFAKREEKIPSVTQLWEGADWYERELFDMFGVHFEGHPDLKRILMPDDWKGHPMCKDYPLTEEPVDFKHGVKPKVPSEIINVRWKQKNIHE
jgi:NADH-quinone oxidoreductase subunit C